MDDASQLGLTARRLIPADMADFATAFAAAAWDRRDLAHVRRLIASDAPVRSPGTAGRGPAPFLADLYATASELPEVEALSEAVIAAPTPADRGSEAGAYASHRLTITGRHAGPGRFGAPTGQDLRMGLHLEMWRAGDAVCDLWMVPDRSACLRTLGRDPKGWAAEMIAARGGPERCQLPLTPDTDEEGPYLGYGNGAPPADDLSGMMKEMMGGAFSVIPRRYDRACELAYPGGTRGQGWAAADRFWLGLRAALPSAAFRVEHALGQTAEGQAPTAALRWTLYGKHDGAGVFGPPTGAYLYVMGITHAEFGPGGLRREWTLYDETAIWTQILLSTG